MLGLRVVAICICLVKYANSKPTLRPTWTVLKQNHHMGKKLWALGRPLSLVRKYESKTASAPTQG